MQVRGALIAVALTTSLGACVLLGACGGSSPDAGKTATAQPVPPASSTLAATTLTTSKAPLAVPTTVPEQGPAKPAATTPATKRTGAATPTTGTAVIKRAASTTGSVARRTTAPATGAPATAAPATAAATTGKVPKKTTVWEPTVPQTSASLAGWALLDAWVARNRSTALEDASPAAVSALFVYVYPAAGVQYRGCSSPPGNTASNCVYRDGNDLLSLTVSLFPRGWAVTGAVLES